jgi:hypothetical protein
MKVVFPLIVLLGWGIALPSVSRTMFKQLEDVPSERRLESPQHPHHHSHTSTRRLRYTGHRNSRNRRASHAHHHSSRSIRIHIVGNQAKIVPQGANTQSRKAQVTQTTPGIHSSGTVSINTQTSLDKVIQASIKNSPDQRPQIIVINQPVPVGTEGNLGPISNYNLNKGAYITGPYPPADIILTGPVTAYEADGLITMLSDISRLYSSFYDMLPNEQPTYNPSDHALNVMEFYGKVRAFVNGFMAVRLKLQTDINFVVSRLITLRLGQDNMLKFYGFYSGFSLLRKRTIVYEARDPMFKTYAAMVKSSVDNYSTFVNAILGKAYTLQKLSKYLENEIVQLKHRDVTDNMLFVIDKFNDVLMFVVHVLEIRSELLGNAGNMQKDLVMVKGLRRHFETLLTQIDQRVTTDQNMDKASLLTNRTQAKFGTSALLTAFSAILLTTFAF